MLSDSEIKAICEGTREALSVRNLSLELTFDLGLSILIFEDNNKCKSKHLNVKLYFESDLVRDDVVQLRHISTEKQIADVLTKGLNSVRFEYLRHHLNVY